MMKRAPEENDDQPSNKKQKFSDSLGEGVSSLRFLDYWPIQKWSLSQEDLPEKAFPRLLFFGHASWIQVTHPLGSEFTSTPPKPKKSFFNYQNLTKPHTVMEQLFMKHPLQYLQTDYAGKIETPMSRFLTPAMVDVCPQTSLPSRLGSRTLRKQLQKDTITKQFGATFEGPEKTHSLFFWPRVHFFSLLDMPILQFLLGDSLFLFFSPLLKFLKNFLNFHILQQAIFQIQFINTNQFVLVEN